MISKEKFIGYMESYKELTDIEEILNSAVKLFCPDFNNFYLDKHSSLILNMLKDLVDDTYDLLTIIFMNLIGAKMEQIVLQKLILVKNIH